MKNHISHFLCILFALLISPHLQAQIITTIAGNGTPGYSGDGGPAVAAEITHPIGVAVDNSGNIYFSEYDSNRVRKVNTEGVITTIAGTGVRGYNGDEIQATAAELNFPFGLAVDRAGNLYICDQDNGRVRKVNPAGIITTFAGGDAGYLGEGNNGPATAAALSAPINITLDNYDNVYITELDALVRKVDTFGIITIVAGTPTLGGTGPDGGMATATPLDDVYGVAVDNAGNIYIAENNGNRIRKVNTAGIISTVAGTGIAGDNGDGGQATAADIMDVDVVVDGAGNLFISDGTADGHIRKVNTNGIITTIAGGGTTLGDGGPAVDCELNAPADIALDESGNMYITDEHNNRIRRIASIATPENIENITTKPITVYPNPSKGLFIATVPSDIEEQTKIIITNMLGEKVKELTAETNEPANIWLDVPSGVYFLSAVTPSGIYNKELVVNR